MGVDPDAREAGGLVCWWQRLLTLRPGREGAIPMGFTEIAVMTGALAALATLRFGVPLVVTWLIGKAANHFSHTA
jgi:hypothetical protein